MRDRQCGVAWWWIWSDTGGGGAAWTGAAGRDAGRAAEWRAVSGAVPGGDTEPEAPHWMVLRVHYQAAAGGEESDAAQGEASAGRCCAAFQHQHGVARCIQTDKLWCYIHLIMYLFTFTNLTFYTCIIISYCDKNWKWMCENTPEMIYTKIF